jgi:hypothetical protein
MPSVSEKIKEHYEEEGIKGVTDSFWNNLKRIFSIYVYFHKKGRMLEWTLTDPIPDVEPPGVDIEIRRLKEDEIPCFKDIISKRKEELFRNRLKQGKVCLVAWHRGEVVWFGWVTTGKLSRGLEHEPVFDVGLRLQSDEGYLLDAFTRPGYRGMNLHTFMSAKRLETLKEMGATRAFGVAAKQNIASRKAHQKGGCVETKEVSYINILGIKFHLWKDLRTKV